MKKNITIITLVALLTITTTAFAQTPNWSTYNGGQLLLKFAPSSIELGRGWQSYVRGVVFHMPTQNFTQLWGYFGAKRGITTLYGGLAYNWHGTDPVFAGFNTDVPFGRCVWSTELDAITNTHYLEQYLWTGIDVNYTVFGNHDLWFGPQLEATRTGKTCAQVGARIGVDKVQFGFYAGDRGYNTRLNITVSLK